MYYDRGKKEKKKNATAREKVRKLLCEREEEKERIL